MNVGTLRINHTGITVSDLQRSKRFYEDVLGFRSEVEDEKQGEAVSAVVGFPDTHLKIAMLSLGDTVIELIQYFHPQPGHMQGRNCDVGAAHIAFETADIERSVQDLAAQGITSTPVFYVASGPQKGRSFSYFADPDGITLELYQRPKA